MIFDTHAHYDDEQFNYDRDQLIKSLPENGIDMVVNVSSTISSIEDTIALTKQYSFFYGAIGIHPTETAELNEEEINKIRTLSKENKIVAIGEIGLDYYWNEPERAIQKKWLERQIELAREVGLPLIIHSRDAAKDTLDIMKALHTEEIGGVIHCFSYGIDMAKYYLDMGFYLGIGGVITFSNAKKLKEVVSYAPIDQLVLETDCPYLAPVPNRGKRNSSLNLTYVVKEIAQIKELSCEEVILKTEKNASQLYRIKNA